MNNWHSGFAFPWFVWKSMNIKSKMKLFEKVYECFREKLKHDYYNYFWSNFILTPLENLHIFLDNGFYITVDDCTAYINYIPVIIADFPNSFSSKSVSNFALSVHYKNIGEIKWEDIIKVNTGNLTDLNYKDGLLKNHVSKLKLE